MKHLFYYQTDIGRIAVAENGSAVTNLYFQGEEIPSDAVTGETELLKEAGRQLREYFAGERKEFTLPLAPSGTPFQQKVWESLCRIPFGETRSYKDIAQSVGSPKAFRAVGMANNRNPIPVLIPCHRVIGADGKMVGYGGGIAIKEFLLHLENPDAQTK